MAMTMDRVLRLTAGGGAPCGNFSWHNPAQDVHWFWKAFLTLMAINQIQSAFTNWCPVMVLYRKLGIKECKEYK